MVELIVSRLELVVANGRGDTGDHQLHGLAASVERGVELLA